MNILCAGRVAGREREREIESETGVLQKAPSSVDE